MGRPSACKAIISFSFNLVVALEQEMKANAQEARAKVIEAETQIPLAIAEAFRNGNPGILDYMKYKNIMDDTFMRESIAAEEQSRKKK